MRLRRVNSESRRSRNLSTLPQAFCMRCAAVARGAVRLAIISLPLLIASGTARAQTETVLYDFTYQQSGGAGGVTPVGPVTPDNLGNLYGMTNEGGAYDYGVVYELSPGCLESWCETVLHSFSATDGHFPSSNVIFDAAGNLYGTTPNGGANGDGIAFELSQANCGGGWCETVLYNFGADATQPQSGLTWDSLGNLYGAASNGVFELSPDGNGGWTEQLIYQTEITSAGLTFDASGNLYGISDFNVFKLSFLNGSWTPSILYSFPSANGEGYASGSPVVDSSGNIYGTAYVGPGSGKNPCENGCGYVWELVPVTMGKKEGTYSEKTLHVFGAPKTGIYPYAGVVFDAVGNMYGTASEGGKYGYGVVFELVGNGTGYKFRTLWSFNETDGRSPSASLLLDGSGHLYGTTAVNVFELTPSPIVTQTTLVASPNPSTSGETVIFAATVESSSGAPPDGETVSFMEGSTLLGTGSLSAGSATLAVSSLPVGASRVDAVYGGDIDFSGSTSNAVREIVKQ
jgi:uncharacterized repeat protein (TIGR03803 family)